MTPCWKHGWIFWGVMSHLTNKIHIVINSRLSISLRKALLITRLGNCRVRVSVFGSKSCIFLAVCGQIWLKILGTYDLRSSLKYTKFLLIWSTESWETQLLKGKVTNPHTAISKPVEQGWGVPAVQYRPSTPVLGNLGPVTDWRSYFYNSGIVRTRGLLHKMFRLLYRIVRLKGQTDFSL